MTSTKALIPFAYGDALVRAVDRPDGELWFVAADVCDILGIKNHRDALDRLDVDEKGVALTDTLGGAQEILTLSEGGLYTLILRSRSAVTPGTPAHRFRRWVTSELLPAVRQRQQAERGYGGRLADDPGRLKTALAMVREARLLWGARAAEELWRRLELPGLASAPGSQDADISAEVRAFIRQRLEPSEGCSVAARELYIAYTAWCGHEGRLPATEAKFGREMKHHIRCSTGGRRRYLGHRMRAVA